jgi:hypothetical protein
MRTSLILMSFETHFISIIKSNLSTLFREIIDTYYENHIKHTLWRKVRLNANEDGTNIKH